MPPEREQTLSTLQTVEQIGTAMASPMLKNKMQEQIITTLIQMGTDFPMVGKYLTV
jgi:hypothetical protein